MRLENNRPMTNSLIIVLNVTLSLLVFLSLGALVRVAHRLPSSAPHHDELWGKGGNPWVVSDPLPLAQLAAHEDERELVRAA
jgi:hypothetical protein